MRETRTFLICPECKYMGNFSLGSVIGDRVCPACNWMGKAGDVITREFQVETLTLTMIDWHVIDELVYDFYGHSDDKFKLPHFEMVGNGSWCNDSSHQFNVEPKVDSYAKKDAEKFRKDGKPRGLCNAEVMNILCEDGWLEPGNYLVEVCW